MDHQQTVLKLKPLFNIFNPKVYSPFLLLFSVIILNGAVLFSKGKFEFPVYPLAGATVLFLLTFILCSYCPQKITVSKSAVEFEDHIRIRPKYRRSKGFHFQKVYFTVSNPYHIQYHQNPIEKLFDIGHISFCGNARFTANKNLEEIEAPPVFRIYGIPHFSSFKENFL